MTATHSHPLMPSLAEQISGRWWVHLLRGLAAISFGILALVWPGQTLLTLVLIYGAFALIDGVLAIVAAVLGRAGRTRSSSTWLLIATAVLGICSGVVTLMWPGIVVTGLVVYVGAWATIRGVIDAFEAIQLRGEIPDAWQQLVSGMLSIAFGLLVFMAPKVGFAVIVWPVAICAILAGLFLVGFSFRLGRLA